jgi:tetratricopeptide (TPR) repeat protein
MPRESKRRYRKSILILMLGVLVIALIGSFQFLRPDPAAERRERLSKADLAMKGGQYEDARLLLLALVEETPDQVRLRHSLAACLVRLGRLGQAAKVARGTLERDPTYAPAHAVLALAARADGRIGEALESARRATVGKNVAPDATWHLAGLLLESGLRTEGVRTLAMAVENGEGGEEAALRLALLVEPGGPGGVADARAARALANALASAEKAYRADPGDRDRFRRYAELKIAAGGAGTVVADLIDRRVTLGLDGRETLLLSRALSLTGAGDRAHAVLAKWEEGGFDPALTEDLVRAWLHLGDPARAVGLLDRAGEERPEDPLPAELSLQARAALYDRLVPGDPARAELLSRMEALAGEVLLDRRLDEVALRTRCRARIAREEFGAAYEDARLLSTVAPGDPGAEWLQGVCLYHLGHPASALERLVRGRFAVPEPQEAGRLLARAALAAGRPELLDLLSPPLTGDETIALRAAAAALTGDLDGAEELLLSPGFAGSPLGDRVAAATAVAGRGRADLARPILDEARPFALTSSQWFALAAGYRALPDDEEAERALARAGDTARGRVGALTRLGLLRLAKDPPDRAGFDAVLAELSTRPDGQAPAFVLSGRRALQDGDFREALGLAEQALAILPADGEARALRFAALMKLRSPVADLALAAEAVLEILPGHGPARMFRAQTLYIQARQDLLEGRSAPAARDLDTARELFPESARVATLRSLARMDLGDLEAAREDARALCRDPNQAAKGFFLLGLVDLRQGLMEKAADHLRQATLAAPDLTAPLPALGRVLLALDRGEEALEVADRWAELDPEDVGPLWLRVPALAALGRTEQALKTIDQLRRQGAPAATTALAAVRIRIDIGDLAEARADLEVLLEIDPACGEAYRLLAAISILEKNRELALHAADRAAEVEGFGAAAHLLRAQVHGAFADAAGELAELSRAVEADPADPIGREMLGRALLARQRLAEGREELLEAARLSPENAEVALTLAMLAESEGRLPEAIEFYERAVRLDPANPVAANNLAFHLTGISGREAEAVRLAEFAVARAPESGDFRDTAAAAYARAGRLSEASQSASEAMRLSPKDPFIALRAGEIFLETGEVGRARSALDRAEQVATGEVRAAVLREAKILRMKLRGR